VPTNDPSRPRAKPITRRTILSRRDALTADERAAASAEIARRAGELLTAARVIALYAPKGSEADTAALDALARTGGARVVYPRVVDGERTLAFHAVTAAELVPGRFGLLEPARDPATSVELAAIDAFVVPGLAFDRSGGRVGWGLGHYDATLARVPGALRIGLAFECQLVDAVPLDPHDVRLHAVVTEVAIYKTGA